jgi:hypothetical protein
MADALKMAPHSFALHQAGAAARLGVVTLVYGLHLAIALTFAWPIAKLVADPALAHPRGDHILFEPGALYLSEMLNLNRASLTSVAYGMSFGVLLAAYLSLVPLGALLFALARSGKLSSSLLLAAAGRLFGPLSLLLGFAVVAMAFAGFVPTAIGGLLDEKLKPLFGDRGEDIAQAAFRLIALFLVAIVGIVHDLSRASLVVRDLPAMQALLLGVAAFRAQTVRALAGWGARASLGLLAVVVVAFATTHTGIETAPRFATVLVLHQAVAFALVFLRADWLAHAIRLVSATPR